TEEKLRLVLEANGVRLDDLTEAERVEVSDALGRMSGKSGSGATGRTAKPKESPATSASPSSSALPVERKSNSSSRSSRTIKNQKEIVIEIAALKGKGYPSP